MSLLLNYFPAILILALLAFIWFKITAKIIKVILLLVLLGIVAYIFIV